jgi:hypothetical protein
MDFTRKTYPHFHQAAIATALTLSVLSPAAWSEGCNEYPAVPLTVNITGESDNFCDDQISLREAISYANYRLTGKNTVTFASTLKGKVIEVADGLIDVRESISISGIDDADLITLKADTEAPLFYIESSADRIDFDLSNVILEKQAGSNHIIEMDGYGGDVNLDNIHTTDATRAYGIFTSQTNESENNDLTLTLKNSSITGSIFDESALEAFSILNNINESESSSDQRIKILNSTIASASGWALAAAASGGKGSSSNSSASIIFESSIVGNDSNFNYLLASESPLGKAEIKIQDSKITDNQSRILASAYSGKESDVQFKNTTVTGNQVSSILVSNAFNPGASDNAIIDITESTISENIIKYNGIVTSSDSGSINIDNSILCDNITDYGGDIPGDYPIIQTYNADLNITKTTICNNQLAAINIEQNNGSVSSASILDSRISNNHMGNGPAGIHAIASSNSTLNLNINNSSINSNSGFGAGIDVDSSNQSALNLNIQNTTISGNKNINGWDKGGIDASLDNDSFMDIDISNATITKNDSTSEGAGLRIRGSRDNYSATISNSIIADNSTPYGSDNDLYGSFNVETSLIKDNSTNYDTTINGTVIDQLGDDAEQTPDIDNNFLGIDPLLQDLALSGGSWVHQLSADSPAFAAGNALAGNLPEFDQRGEGFARLRTGNGIAELDLGAVQYFANPVAVNDEVSVTTASENNLINVLNNDAQNSDGLALDAGSITIMTHPENGTAEAQQDGTISYTPNAGFVGEDSLIYMLQDIAGNNSTEAKLTITVSENSDSGGPLQLWILSLLALFGLRQNKHLKKSSKYTT